MYLFLVMWLYLLNVSDNIFVDMEVVIVEIKFNIGVDDGKCGKFWKKFENW